jgi:hypothetical protein
MTLAADDTPGRIVATLAFSRLLKKSLAGLSRR